MARQEHAREDFLADATAMVERIELRPAGVVDPVLAGFRHDGSLSLLFGEDPVYQFNSLGQLRRAFVGGRMLKAAHCRLVAIERSSSGGRMRLVTVELSADAAAKIVRALTARLTELADTIKAGRVKIVGCVPAEAEVLARLTGWLTTHANKIEIAASPHAR